MLKFSIERTFNSPELGAYNSVRFFYSIELDSADTETVLNVSKYFTILADMAYFNYVSKSPVVNSTLTKETVDVFKEALEKLHGKVEVHFINNKEE